MIRDVTKIGFKTSVSRVDADLFVKKNIELLKVRKRNFIVYRALDHGGRVFQLQTKNRS